MLEMPLQTQHNETLQPSRSGIRLLLLMLALCFAASSEISLSAESNNRISARVTGGAFSIALPPRWVSQAERANQVGAALVLTPSSQAERDLPPVSIIARHVADKTQTEAAVRFETAFTLMDRSARFRPISVPDLPSNVRIRQLASTRLPPLAYAQLSLGPGVLNISFDAIDARSYDENIAVFIAVIKSYRETD